MDARMWHQQATTPPPTLPDPIPVEVFDDLPDVQQDAYWQALTFALGTLVLPSILAEHAALHLTRIVERNQRRPPGAKWIGSVSAPFAIGKSTFVKAWAHTLYRHELGPAYADPRPPRSPRARWGSSRRCRRGRSSRWGPVKASSASPPPA